MSCLSILFSAVFCLLLLHVVLEQLKESTILLSSISHRIMIILASSIQQHPAKHHLFRHYFKFHLQRRTVSHATIQHQCTVKHPVQIHTMNASSQATQLEVHPTQKQDILKCPTCNHQHHAKTDVFGNCRGKTKDFDARELFGVTATCPICLDDCSELIVLKCGHILCKGDYQRLGGHVRGICDPANPHDDESTDSILLNIRRAGQSRVNGTYRKDVINNKYTQLGRWNGEDAEFSIETRVVDGKKMWFISCQHGEELPIDFYKAPVNEGSNYPPEIGWRTATLHGQSPHPRISVSYFGSA